MLLLGLGLVGIKGRVLNGGGCVVGAALAVLVGLRLQVVFALGVLACQVACGRVEQGPWRRPGLRRHLAADAQGLGQEAPVQRAGEHGCVGWVFGGVGEGIAGLVRCCW